MRLVALLLLLAAPAAAVTCPEGGREIEKKRTERTYYCAFGNGTHSVTSGLEPFFWWDGERWRDPVYRWDHSRTLRSIPGPLIYAVDPDGLRIERRDGTRLGKLRLDVTGVLGADLRFRWDDFECVLRAEKGGLKLACPVAEAQGARRLTLATEGTWLLDGKGGVSLGDFTIPAVVLIGSDGADYLNRGEWTVQPGALSLRWVDTGVPVPYVLDPVTVACTGAGQPGCPGTCAEVAFASGTIAWSNESNALTSNNSYATASVTNTATTEWLQCTNFGFIDPPFDAAKVIKGVYVEVEAKGSVGSALRLTNARIVKAGTIQSTNRCLTGTCSGTPQPCQCLLTTSDAARSIGGSTDLWGTTLAPADVTDSGFGVAVAISNATATPRTASVDTMRVTIYYAPPSGPVFAGGFESFSAEGGTVVGSPAYLTAAARTGVGGLQISTAANTAESWCTPPARDADLTDRGYVRHYWSTNPTIPTGGAIVPVFVQQDSEVGCYLRVAKDGNGCLSYQALYHGKEDADINFGTTRATNSPTTSCVTTLAGTAVALGQIIEGNRVSCPLSINGSLAQSFSLTMTGDCSSGACDIAAACLGTPAVGAVDSYASFPAFAFDADDMAVNNLADPGVGRVLALFPDAACFVAGDCSAWTNSGGQSGFATMEDFRTEAGAADSQCLGTTTPTDSQRSKTSPASIDLWQMDEISPALGATDVIRSVRLVVKACAKAGGTNPTVNAEMKQCTSDANCTGATSSTGTAQTPAADTVYFLDEIYSDNLSAATPWTEAQVNALHVGMRLTTAAGREVRNTAMVVYVEIQSPSPRADRSMQDWNGDGYLTCLTGLDSITRGTASSTCFQAIDDDPCTRACTADSDCDGGTCVTNANGSMSCQQACDVNQDCTCGDNAVCASALNWVNQFSLLAPQCDIIINCGRNLMTTQWFASQLPTLLTTPVDLSPPCILVRGDWGHCSATTTQGCAQDGECPVGQTCVQHPPDYVIMLGGYNEMHNFGPGTQESNALFGAPAIASRWNERSLPLAATSPGAYQVPRITCTTNADCDDPPPTGLGADALCMGYCEGHTDPVWPCIHPSSGGTSSEGGCNTCANDNTKACPYPGVCTGSGSAYFPETCDSDADCGGGLDVCALYEPLYGPWGDAFGLTTANCGTCEARACLNDVKYCVASCSSLTCDDDGDCADPTNGLPGVCDIGAGTCRLCGAGAGIDVGGDAAAQLAIAKRLNTSVGEYRADQILARQLAITATIEAAGARALWSTYMQSALMGFNPVLVDNLLAKMRGELKFENVVDAHHAGKFYDNRLIGFPGTGSLIYLDGLHTFLEGAAILAKLIAASCNTLYPVCSGDSSDLCGYCKVPCTSAADCDQGGSGETCSGSVCHCATNADCDANCTCQDIDATGGTDNRCVCENITDCPIGNGATFRERPASDALCSAGTCSDERVPPLCTTSKQRCVTTADCPGARGGTPTPGTQMARGDVCAADGVWIQCQVDAECRDGGVYPDDVCAPAPVVGASPTPKVRLCMQPTPTP